MIFSEFDLYKVIERNPKLLTEASTKKVAYQLVLALNYLHSAEIIHRDLKVFTKKYFQSLNFLTLSIVLKNISI